MALEIELKLRCDKSALPALARQLTALGGVKQRAITLANTYYDTPALSLHDKRIALRVRQAGRRLLQTVKTAGTVKNGLSQRNEWECAYTGQFDFALVDDLPLKQFLTKHAASLTPIFTTHFKRTRWLIAFDKAQIEARADFRAGIRAAVGRRAGLARLAPQACRHRCFVARKRQQSGARLRTGSRRCHEGVITQGQDEGPQDGHSWHGPFVVASR